MFSYGPVRPLEQRQQAEAVLTRVVRQLSAEDISDGGDEVCVMYKLSANAAGLYHRWPANDERLAMAAFMHVGFIASQRSARKMPAGFEILGTCVGREPVIAGEEDQCVVGFAGFFGVDLKADRFKS